MPHIVAIGLGLLMPLRFLLAVAVTLHALRT